MDERPGFLVPEAIATLVIDQGVYAGAEIDARLTLSPAVYFGTKQWLAAFEDAVDGDATMAAARELASIFHAHGLVGWNLRYSYGPQTGEPIPTSVDGILSLGIDLVARVVAVWIGAIGQAPLPLPVARPTGPVGRAKRTKKRRGSTGSSSIAAFRPRS